MKLSTTEARNQFSEVINRAAFGNERVQLFRRGKPIAAVVPIRDIKILSHLENLIHARLVEIQDPESIEADSMSIDALISELGLDNNNGKKETI